MADSRRCAPGGIFGLVELIDAHPAAFVFDWRTRFGVPLLDALEEPDWWELVHLVRELTKRPDSHVAAALAEWEHPWTWESWLLANIFDQWSTKNAQPYPRPSDRRHRVRSGRPGVGQRQVLAALAARGHGRAVG